MTLLTRSIPNTEISCAVDTSTKMLSLKQGDQILTCSIAKSTFFKDVQRITTIALSADKIYIATKGPSMCKVLVYRYTDQYLTEDTCIDLSTRVSEVELIILHEELLFMTEILLQSKASSHTVVTVYSFDKDALEYNIRFTLFPQIQEAEDFGVDIAVTADRIVVLGTYRVNEEDGFDTCYSLTLYANNKISNLLTGISQLDVVNSSIELKGIVIYLDDKAIAMVMKEGLTMIDGAVDGNDTTDLNNLTVSEVPTVTERIHNLSVEDIGLGPIPVVAPTVMDTKQLPETGKQNAIDRQAMITRQHLLVQQLLNNMSIAIKENKVERFSIKTLELTEERIRITGLEFIPRG